MHFTVEAQNILRGYVESQPLFRPLLALDGTAGNGFDTCFLAALVGEQGKVLAIDLQHRAIEMTQAKLSELGYLDRVDCVCDCHSNLTTYLNGRYRDGFDIVMFNLGYLPLGDKQIITKQQTTLPALEKAFSALNSNGIMSVLSYPGHFGGSEEHVAVDAWIETTKTLAVVDSFRDQNNISSPVLWVLKPL